MRPSNKSRSRNKQGNTGGHNGQRRNTMGNIINRVFESAGPDGKVRGTPQQIIDKYQALARDAQLAGDRVACESYLQYSEHYSRLLGEAQRQQQEQRFNQERDDRGGDGGIDGGGFEQRRPQQPQQQPAVASGLAMIDPEDSDDFSGPIETPESRPYRREEPVPSMGGERRQERAERQQVRTDRGERSDRGERPRREATPAQQPEPVAAAVAPEPRSETPASEAEAAPATPLTTAAPDAPPEAGAESAPDQAAEAAPAPAPKRRRRPRAEAPAAAPVVEAE